MATRLTNRTTAYDGSSSPITATAAIRLTISGRADGAMLRIHSRTDSNTAYQNDKLPTHGRPRVALTSGDSYYYTLDNVGANTSLSVSDAPE